MKRYFEKLIGGDELTPHYPVFWEIEIEESSISERFGTRGVQGDSQTTRWETHAEAMYRAKQQIFERERLGYIEQPMPPEIVAVPSIFAVKRYFVKYVHAKNNIVRTQINFWEIIILGRSVSERFGMHGTRGDTKVSLCASLEEALEWGKVLKEEKERDGYIEQPIPVLPIPKPYEPKPDSTKPQHERFYGRLDALTEERFVHCLDQASKGPSEGFFMNPSASMESIAALESGCKIILPKSLRSFLLRYDGGFVWRRQGTELDLLEEQKYHPEKTEMELKLSVSFPLFSTSEISASYRKPGVIPFCRTINGEVLAVWSMRQPHQDSPVLDAFHEETACQWSTLFPTFAHLFIHYVEKQGGIYELGS